MHAARSTHSLVATLVLAALAVLILVGALLMAPLVYGSDSGPEPITERDALVIGVSDDRPGLSMRNRKGELEGFDIDVATYIAGQLDIDPKDVTFKPVPLDQRENSLRRGKVDMVIASYSITPERQDQVTFAGPYYVAHQDILVRRDDSSIRSVRDLRGRRICQVAGSNSWRRVIEERRVPATLVPADSYGDCVRALVAGRLDAVSSDDLILAGFAASAPKQVRVVNAPFTDEPYGVGLRREDVQGCRAVNRILAGMYENGAAKTLLGQWFSTSGLNVTPTVPRFEGCA